MGPTWGPSGADRTQVGPMFVPWTLLSGDITQYSFLLPLVTYSVSRIHHYRFTCSNKLKGVWSFIVTLIGNLWPCIYLKKTFLQETNFVITVSVDVVAPKGVVQWEGTKVTTKLHMFCTDFILNNLFYQMTTFKISWNLVALWVLTHWPLVMPCGITDLGQHWFR